jgi:hypothetical protein
MLQRLLSTGNIPHYQSGNQLSFRVKIEVIKQWYELFCWDTERLLLF